MIELRDLYRRARAHLLQIKAASLENVRSALFKAVLVFSALTALNGVFGSTAGSFDPSTATAVRAMLALWAGLHLPLYLLERRRAELAYFVYVSLSFIVLAIIFDNTTFSAEERVGVQFSYHGAMILVALLWLPFAKFVLFSSLTTVLQVFMAYANLRGGRPELLVGATLTLFVQWIPGLAAAWLLRRHYQIILDYRTKLAGHKERLEKEVRDRTRTIEQQQQRLLHAEKMRAIGTLAGGLAHDLNNILAGVLGHASLLSDKIVSKGAEIHVDTIVSCANRASDLTMRMLAFARGGKKEIGVVDVNEVVEDVVALLAASIPKSIEVTLDLEDGLPAVEGDRSQLEDAVMNICLNSRDAMPGGGKLLLRTRSVLAGDPQAEARGMEQGQHVAFTVRVTGIGMDERTRTRIFDPFFTTKGGSGTGLGLSMVHKIVESHGGSIAVESEPGKGTTFSIWLPATEKRPADIALPEKEPQRGREGVLVVDDQQVVAEVAREILSSLGYSVLTASGGAEAVRTLAERGDEISLVLLDLEMPGMDGLATFEEMKRIRRDIKVVLYSGYSVDARIDTALERGVRGFMPKPFDVSSIAGKVREVLDA